MSFPLNVAELPAYHINEIYVDDILKWVGWNTGLTYISELRKRLTQAARDHPHMSYYDVLDTKRLMGRRHIVYSVGDHTVGLRWYNVTPL